MPLNSIRKELKQLADSSKAKLLQGFFKTGPGEYGEGDIFLGIQVPRIREVERANKTCSLATIGALMKSRYHEERLLGLLLLVQRFNTASPAEQRKIFGIYLRNTNYINNWDLVDLSAPNIVGVYLLDKPRRHLRKLARSKSLWERRIAIVATAQFIRNGQFDDTLEIAEMLMNDREDLIHKAVGWMLREVGKRDMKTEEDFVRQHCSRMPRTMLRYAIERFPEPRRLKYLRAPSEV